MIGCELCSSARGAITPWAVGGVTRMLCGACRSKYPQDDDSSERDELAHLRAALATAERELAEARAELAKEESWANDLTTERDTLRAEVERLRAAGAWKPEEVWREEVADEVAEQIAVFVGDFMDSEPPGDWRLIPRLIRAGSWRKETP